MDRSLKDIEQRIKAMPRKEVYCEACGIFQPMIEHAPQKYARDPYPCYDITCGTCCSIIATVQIVPGDKPLEPSQAVAPEPSNPRSTARIWRLCAKRE